MYKLFKFKSYLEKKGNLIPISFSKNLGFKVKRVFLKQCFYFCEKLNRDTINLFKKRNR